MRIKSVIKVHTKKIGPCTVLRYADQWYNFWNIWHAQMKRFPHVYEAFSKLWMNVHVFDEAQPVSVNVLDVMVSFIMLISHIFIDHIVQLL